MGLIPSNVKGVVDNLSLIGLTAVWLDTFSTVTAILATTLTAIWYIIRIYEWWKEKK